MKDYTRVPGNRQGIDAMRCRVWNENLAAYFVADPLPNIPEQSIETPATCERESDGAA
jgi:hypothetical protein